MKKPKQKRPFLASDVKSLVDAERWRSQVLREIGKKVSEIQNAALGEHRIRDLNDEINKLMREKSHWEKRILELGGTNHFAAGSKIMDSNGKEAAAYGGYRYFGEAKNLPGVRDMIEKPKFPTSKRNRGELYRGVDADYYGYRDDEDGLLEEQEGQSEQLILKKAKQDWQDKRIERGENAEEEEEPQPEEILHQHDFVAHVPIPSKEDLETAILNKRKEELLKKYVSGEAEFDESRKG